MPSNNNPTNPKMPSNNNPTNPKIPSNNNPTDLRYHRIIIQAI